MGAYAPAPVVTHEVLAQVERDIIGPTLRGMRESGNPYRGCLYCGLMIKDNEAKVIEFNCRFGDPETQVVIPLLDGDLADILMSVAERRLDPKSVKQHPASSVCVVMASGGYPDDYQTGKPIQGLERIKPEEGLVVFHAGTRSEGQQVLSSGGRVLGVTAIGYAHDLKDTVRAAYRGVGTLTFDGAYYRSDIALRALRRLAHIKT
jgi:phosphoribosylamine--glycine ligase